MPVIYCWQLNRRELLSSNKIFGRNFLSIFLIKIFIKYEKIIKSAIIADLILF